MSERKTAIITGASRGIGRATAVRLAKMGMDIVFTYNSGSEAAQETKALCEAEGAKVLAVCSDVSKSENCEKVAAQALEAFGRVDVLVNNAGITRDSLIIRMTDEQFDQVIDNNLKGAFYMMRAVSKQMMKQRCGSIINISSVVGVMGNAGQVNYAASKAGIIGMTKSLAREFASRKVTVNAVAPGMIATDMTAVMSDKAKEAMKGAIPMGEMGNPEDIAGTVAFLAGEESRYITGQVICVDGGMAI